MDATTSQPNADHWFPEDDEEDLLPVPDQCWRLFCHGHSFAAIGRTLHLDRETVARHIRTLHAELQQDRRADRSLELSRALARQDAIQAQAWATLHAVEAQHAAALQALLHPPAELLQRDPLAAVQ